jgi:ribosomal protein S18 acetylase RimI-like enzyme
VLQIRPVDPSEHEAVADLLAPTYLAEGWADPSYEPTMRDVAHRAAHALVLVAVLDGRLVGTVTVALEGGPYAEMADPGEAVIRMLVVDPAARGHGAGKALVAACLDAARQADCTAVRLSTQVPMTTAIRIYEDAGFRRTPERDWTPVPGIDLIAYHLPLRYCGHCGEAGVEHPDPLDPPRFCDRCRRRMVVQVHPTGWSARCVEHGVRTG